MVTILFVLGVGAAAGVAVWAARRAGGTGSNHYLGGSGGGTGVYGDGGSWSGGDGWSGGDSGGGGGGGDGGGGGS